MAVIPLSSLATVPNFTSLFFILPFAYCIYNRYFHPLSVYPGPILASISPLWEFFYFTLGDSHLKLIEVHKKYGPVVRVTPNILSVSQADHKFFKNAFGYTSKAHSAAFVFPGPNVFVSIYDKKEHFKRRKQFASNYSLNSFRALEPMVDQKVQGWIYKIDGTFAATGKICDIVRWSRYFSFDQISYLSFSADVGLTKGGSDPKKYVESLGFGIWFLGVLNRFEWIYRLAIKTPMRDNFMPGVKQDPGFGPICRLHAEVIKDKQKAGPTTEKRDLMDRFLSQKNPDGTLIAEDIRQSEALVPLMAGTDTISTTLTRLIYDVATHPAVLSRLRTEVNTFLEQNPHPRDQPLSFMDTKRLPYLSAAVRETLRLTPPFMLMMFRKSSTKSPTAFPNTNLPPCPPGTILVSHPWVSNRTKEVFGVDAEVYRPERWLDPLPHMDVLGLEFGWGSRQCVAREFALADMGKMLCQIIRWFDIEVVRLDGKEGKVHDWGMRSWSFWVGDGYGIRFTQRKEE